MSMPIYSAAGNSCTEFGRAFLVCIVTSCGLRHPLLPYLWHIVERRICPIAELWDPNPGWSAPRSYQQEIGPALVNLVAILSAFHTRDELAALKYVAMEIEDALRYKGKRTVNINPGIVFPSGVLVASHKAKGSVRDLIADGVWGQWMLLTHNGRIEPAAYSFDEYTDEVRLPQFGNLCRNVALHNCAASHGKRAPWWLSSGSVDIEGLLSPKSSLIRTTIRCATSDTWRCMPLASKVASVSISSLASQRGHEVGMWRG